ncbi:MAG TPA: Calx-beta domain-containing protein [Pyrinomonadaceae bacterium]|nr:Calx-beta domain-containing protein [Pyrinomonadaceae bacterium]
MRLPLRFHRRLLMLMLVTVLATMWLWGGTASADVNFLTKWGSFGTGDGQFQDPWRMAVDSAGNVYVADRLNCRIQKFTSAGGYITQWGSPGSGDGQFLQTVGIAIDTLGDVYVVDRDNARVQKFTSTGTFITKWGSFGTSGDGLFNQPYGITVDADGYVYVADSGNNRIQKFTSVGAFVTKWGTDGTGDGQFSFPMGVAVDTAGHVYVVEQNNHRVQRFTSAGTFLAKWGTNGIDGGQFNYPADVAVDSSGNVYIADAHNHRIQKFTSAGTFLAKWGTTGTGDGEFSFPYGVAVSAAGHVYVADPGNNRIQKFGCDDAETYLITQWGTQGTGDGEFHSPTGIARDSSGNIYVADSNNHRIQKFTSTGTYITQWGSVGTGNGEFFSPWGVAVDTSDNVYVADVGNHRIQKFTSTGTYITQWGGPGTVNGEFDNPYGVAVDTDGNVYVADSHNERIQKFTSTGTYITQWAIQGLDPGQASEPIGIVVDASGNIYIAWRFNPRMQKYSATGTLLTEWGSQGSGDGQFQHPSGLALDSSGNVYVADHFNNRIQKFTSAGTFLAKWENPTSGDGLFAYPIGVVLNTSGHIYVANLIGQNVTKFDQTGAPIANAGQDQSFSCVKTTQAVTLDGTASSDPTPGDSPTLSYAWSEGTTVLGTGATLNVNLAPGTHTITLAVTDSCLHSSTDTVTVEVEAYNSVDCNTAPDAVDDAASVAEDSGANAIDVLANDTDFDTGDPKTVTAKTDGANGTVTITGGGTGLTYTPAANFHGSDTFTYTISDGRGGTDTANVNVNVTAANDAPTDIALSASSVPDNSPGNTTVGTLSSTDVDSNTFTYTLVNGAGSTDNNSFAISGSTLKTAALFDFETRSVYSLRVRSTDTGGGFFEEQFLITVADGADTPGSVAFSQASYNVAENAGNTTFTLKRTGGTDNPVVAKVSLTDVTTSAADYTFKPGSADASFNTGTGADNEVWSVASQADGKILIGGKFLNYDGTARTRIARLNPDGTLDASFNPGTGANDIVYAIAVQPDGRILIGGAFTDYNGTARSRIARLNPDGTLDASFNPGAGAAGTVPDVRTILLQPDGKAIIGGNFTMYDGAARGRIARLNSDGTLDTSFAAGAGATGGGVFAMALYSDGKVFVGGAFTMYDGAARGRVARINSDGTLDATFNPSTGAEGSNINVWAVAIQPDGGVLIGGNFTVYNGTARGRIVRANSDGTLDATFNPGTGANSVVWTTTIQPDGKIIVCGAFSAYNGTTRNRILRVNTNGSLDTSFNPGTGANAVILSATAVQPDGRIAFGGQFTTFNGATGNRVARVSGDLFVTWPAGDATDKTITLPVVNDGANESPDETLNLGLAVMSGGAALGSPNTATLTIQDPNDAPANAVPAAQSTAEDTARVFSSANGNQISIADPDAGTNPVRVTLTATSGTVTLNGTGGLSFITGDGTSDATMSFTGTVTNINAALNGLSFAPTANFNGAASLQVLTNDQGQAGTGGALSDTDTVNITVTPVADTPTVTNATTSENAKTTSGLVISRNAADSATTTHFKITAITNGTLYQSDGITVIANNQFITFAQGNAGLKFLPAAGLSSPSSGFNFKAQASTSAADAGLGGSMVTATITVNEGGVLKFSAAAYSVNEATATMTITVTRTGGGSGPTSVKYSTSDGTATGSTSCAAGKDYITKTGTLSWANNDVASKTFALAICHDVVFEGNETINLALSNVTGGGSLAAPQTAVLTIVDNETQPKLSVNSVMVTEGNAGSVNAVFTVKLSGASSKTVTVKYATANGTTNPATAPADYTALPLTTLTFTPGQLSKTVVVAVKGDLIDELDETFRLLLSSPTNAIIAAGAGVGTIKDNDTAAIAITNAAVTEPDAGTINMTFTVNLSLASSRTVTVKYQTANNTATAPADYTALALTTLSFSPGQVSKTVTVQIKGELLVEPNETLFVNLSAPVNAAIADAQGLGTITNDD